MNACDQVFHAPLALYILAEKRPTPDNPDWVEVGGWTRNGAQGMVTYISPVDAMIAAIQRNQTGSRFQVFPFEGIDPRHHLAGHNDWLTIYLVYGFAASENRMIVDAHGALIPLVHGTHFHVTPDMADHFHLRFDDDTVAWLDHLHVQAQIRDYVSVMQGLSEWPSTDILHEAQEALGRIADSVHRAGDITHCGLYDPIERRWRIAALNPTAAPRKRSA